MRYLVTLFASLLLASLVAVIGVGSSSSAAAEKDNGAFQKKEQELKEELREFIEQNESSGSRSELEGALTSKTDDRQKTKRELRKEARDFIRKNLEQPIPRSKVNTFAPMYVADSFAEAQVMAEQAEQAGQEGEVTPQSVGIGNCGVSIFEFTPNTVEEGALNFVIGASFYPVFDIQAVEYTIVSQRFGGTAGPQVTQGGGTPEESLGVDAFADTGTIRVNDGSGVYTGFAVITAQGSLGSAPVLCYSPILFSVGVVP